VFRASVCLAPNVRACVPRSVPAGLQKYTWPAAGDAVWFCATSTVTCEPELLNRDTLSVVSQARSRYTSSTPQVLVQPALLTRTYSPLTGAGPAFSQRKLRLDPAPAGTED
jgi:hypothetical protein